MHRGTTPALFASHLPGLTTQKKMTSDAAPIVNPRQIQVLLTVSEAYL